MTMVVSSKKKIKISTQRDRSIAMTGQPWPRPATIQSRKKVLNKQFARQRVNLDQEL